MKKLYFIIIFILIAIIFYQPARNDNLKEEIKYYEVEVIGCVSRPGVYNLPENTMIKEAIDIAGRQINSIYYDETKYIEKNSKITVLERKNNINLNTCSFDELLSITRIGEATANKIIYQRNINPFTSYFDFIERVDISEKYISEIMCETII